MRPNDTDTRERARDETKRKTKIEAECLSPAGVNELPKTAQQIGNAVLPHIAPSHRLAHRIVSAQSYRSSQRNRRGVRAFAHRSAHAVLRYAVIIIASSPPPLSSPPANHAFAPPTDEPSPSRPANG